MIGEGGGDVVGWFCWWLGVLGSVIGGSLGLCAPFLLARCLRMECEELEEV